MANFGLALLARKGWRFAARSATSGSSPNGGQARPALRGSVTVASIAIHGDEMGPGARLLGAAMALREQLGAPVPSWRRRGQRELEEVARHALGEAPYDASARQGSELSLEDAAAYAAREP